MKYYLVLKEFTSEAWLLCSLVSFSENVILNLEPKAVDCRSIIFLIMDQFAILFAAADIEHSLSLHDAATVVRHKRFGIQRAAQYFNVDESMLKEYAEDNAKYYELKNSLKAAGHLDTPEHKHLQYQRMKSKKNNILPKCNTLCSDKNVIVFVNFYLCIWKISKTLVDVSYKELKRCLRMMNLKNSFCRYPLDTRDEVVNYVQSAVPRPIGRSIGLIGGRRRPSCCSGYFRRFAKFFWFLRVFFNMKAFWIVTFFKQRKMNLI